MTVKVPKIKTKIEAIELTGERIEVKLDHGVRLVDCDVKTEGGRAMPSVDYFIKPFDPDGSPDNYQTVVRAITPFEAEHDQSRQERFIMDASRWGPVRDRFADREELEKAQGQFTFACAVAKRVVSEFSHAAAIDGVTQTSQGKMDYVKLAYTSPRGEPMTCTAYYANGTTPGEPRRLVSFTIDDTIGGRNSDKVRIDVSDPAIINRLRFSLEPVIQRM